VITGTQPDAPYILEGLLDPQTSVRPREIVTDTAGYTDVIFGLFRILGYQYSPRLADAGAATFWRLNPTDYGPLNSLARHQIDRALVEQHYDDLLRVAGSLLQRHTTASQLVHALRSRTRHLASLAKAFQHVGRAAKTIHLLDYCNDQPFRRRILTQLNRGESRHVLARDVCHGHRGELRQRYRQGQERTTRRARRDRQRDRPLQHDLHPTRRSTTSPGKASRSRMPTFSGSARSRPTTSPSPAGIDPDAVAGTGHELAQGGGARVVQVDRSHPRRTIPRTPPAAPRSAQGARPTCR